MAEHLWSVTDLAAYLAVPPATVYRWRTQSTGPPGIKVGKHIRYRASDVEVWLASRAEVGVDGK